MAVGISDLIRDPSIPEIHISDITAFLACRRAWNWTSEHRDNLEPDRPYMPFLTGRAVHLCIERFLAYGETHEQVLPQFIQDELGSIMYTESIRGDGSTVKVESDLWQEIRPQVDDQMALVAGMMDHYYSWEDRQTGPFSYKNLEPITMEQAFKVPILDVANGPADWANQASWICNERATFAGRFDGIVRRKDNGKVYIREDKTTRAIPSRAKLLMNELQPTGYSYAFRLMFPELAKDFAGIMYTFLSKRVPKFPKILTNGMLSQDVKDQSFESYMAAIDKHHPDADNDFVAAHYGKTIMALYKAKESGNTFFERHIVNRTDHAIHQFQGYLNNWADSLLDPTLPTYPTPGYACGYCLMQEPCVALQNEGPQAAQILLDDLYRKRPPRTVEGESEE